MDKNIDDNAVNDGDISLGGGVNVVSPGTQLDDIEIETYNDDVLGGVEDSPQDQLKKLKERLKDAIKEKQGYLDSWQRSQADFVNYKKREEEGKAEFMRFSREELITDLLPALESFHMAFANKESWEKVDQSWRVGVEYIHSQLLQALASHGLTEINPLNALFDPKEHTSIGSIPTTDSKLEHYVGEVAQLGYKLNGKLIRSPRVKVYEVGK